MKKTLLIVAMLLLVAPVMATTTVKILVNPAEQYTTGPDSNKVQPVTVAYVTDVNVRAFALDINIESGPAFHNIRDFKTGESNAASPGYGIFPSRFRDFIVVTGPNWVDPNYNPTTAWNEPETTDHNSGMGWPKMIVEMGTLYAGDANKPAWSGTLFKFDVNSGGAVGTFHITVAANALRGGVVGNDGNTITATYEGNDVCFAPPVCVLPDVVGQAEATATANITAAGFTLGTRTETCCDTPGIDAGEIISTNPAAGSYTCGISVDYVVSTGPCGCTVPNLVGLDRQAARAAIQAAGFPIGTEANVPPTASGQTVRTVIAQIQTAGSVIPCDTPIDFNAVSYPIKQMTTAASLYVNWINRSRPQCWAYARQCHGDADGKKLGTWVGAPDLTIYRSAVGKIDAQIPAGGICADFDHKKLGTWVGAPDLAIYRAYVGKIDAQNPLCGSITTIPSTDPNYWYWCIPTGGAACPTGQKCAPIGVCPNTP